MKHNRIWIHSGWIGNRFIIWGESLPKQGHSQNGFIYPFLVPPFELKLRLFRHDEVSFYGTFITTTRALLQAPLLKRRFQSPAGETTVYQADEQWQSYTFPIEGIQQTLSEFIHSFTLFKSWQADDQLVLSDDFTGWISFMDNLYEVIGSGAVRPDQNGTWSLLVSDEWYDQQLQHFPESTFALSADQSTLKEHKEDEERTARIELLKRIIDSAIRSLLKEGSEANEAYKVWENSIDTNLKPFIQSLGYDQSSRATVTRKDSLFDEELGLKQADPFQTALVLIEPKTPDNSWSVSLSLADKHQPDKLTSMDKLMAGNHPWLTNPVPRLKSDVKRIASHLPLLKQLSLSSPTLDVSADEAYALFTDHHQQLSNLGIKLIVPNWVKRPKTISVQLSEKNEPQEHGADPILNWQSLADFQYTIALGDQTLSEDQFNEYVEGRKPFIYVEGEWLAWDPALAAQLKSYLERVNERYSYLDAWKMVETNSFPDELQEVNMQIDWSDELEQKLTDLYRQSPKPINLPISFNGTLRSYQKEGVDWLAHLRKIGFGGCLADDMGLGKSIQTIAYILYVLQEQSTKKAPFLLICPTSLLFNWSNECERFAPGLTIFIHHGTDRLDENDSRLHNVDLVLTSYTLALKDAYFFEEIHWNGLILDEAQHIKNKETKQRKAIRKIQATHRLALTGTPIENRLTELWSLMDLLNPSLLGNFQRFYQTYIRPIERDGDEQTQQELQALIRPFLLRRTKNDPATDLQLPEKQEQTELVQLSIEQAALYQAVVDDVSNRIQTVSAFERRAMILRTITRLKQICNHPAQFYKDHALEKHESGKWDMFIHLIDAIHARGESVLIFTQYKEMGKMISTHVQNRLEQQVPFLHGGLSRKQRQEVISQFQNNNDITAFVLSLKAGGVGLNLTKATNVIHYDRWWNPAVENQATDRAYRIGQTKQVQVYKLLTTGTVEERIDRLISGKQALADGILASSASQLTELSDEELMSFIQLTHEQERRS
ncbi:DEAD/DEAH box helicase [Bacillus sp. JCM 19041]|uniref:DEAD/DEAH box helicase n=1 Tax=Bacillus sp. JCM 19041 TaxID=1460637 RepID=UPI0006D2BDCC